jgi:hypothetical protein
MGNRLLRKKFMYRDLAGSPQEVHAAHWRNFTWQSGPVVCRAYGPWGQMQVWASSEIEARRVFLHACFIAGWNFNKDLQRMEVGIASDDRTGRIATMQTKESTLGVEVTKRPGPSGFPSIG